MLATLKEIFAAGINEASILAAVKFVLDTLFGFIAKEEGFPFTPAE